jgi:hypothetical protein
MLEYRDYVSIELAKKLKQAGYAERTHAYWGYYPKGNDYNLYVSAVGESTYNEPDYAAPTLYEAQLWLLHKYRLTIITTLRFKTLEHVSTVHRVTDTFIARAFCGSYQKALAAAIDAAVNYVLNKEK